MRDLSIFLVIALGFGLWSCGDAESETGSISRADAVGSYSLDKEHLAASMRAVRMKDLPNEGTLSDEARKEAEAAIDESIEKKIGSATMTLVLKDDGTFVFTITHGGNSEEASGPFSLDGNRITLTRTSVDGKAKKTVRDEDTVTGTISDGVIDLTMDPEDPTVIRLRR